MIWFRLMDKVLLSDYRSKKFDFYSVNDKDFNITKNIL